MDRICIALAFFLCLFASTASAADLPDGSVYADDDPAGYYLSPPPGMRAKFRAMVNAALMKNPRNVAALTHRAYLFLDGGDLERAVRDFNAAVEAAEPGSPEERHLLWSRGWANYDLARYEDTRRDWQRAVQLHGGHPYWASYSFALLYWTLGEHDAALTWFDATAASLPEWRTADGVEAKIKFWSPNQQEQMRALFAAWRAKNASGSAP